MHCVFHGVLTDMFELIIRVFVPFGIQRYGFRWFVNQRLIGIKKLGNPFFEAVPFSEKANNEFSFSGWVGGNKTALCFILRYLLSHLRQFLLYHCPHRANKERKQKWEDEMEATWREVIDLVHAFECLASRLLSQEISEELVEDVDEYAKLFITLYTNLEIERI